MDPIKVINLAGKFDLVKDFWKPAIVGEVNDSHVKIVKLKGEFMWHHHDIEDELFLVIQGKLIIKLEKEDLVVNPGEFVIIPHGIEHKPLAEEEVQVLLLEPKTTINSGNLNNERTVKPEWI